MYQNVIYRDINEALPDLLSRAMTKGLVTESRNGRTRELWQVGITLTQPRSREILLPNRKANIAAQIAETAWLLAGRDDIEWLTHYLPRAKDFSDDGGSTWRGAYGPRLRDWKGCVDQLDYVVEALRADPASRQAVMSIWDPGVDTNPGKDRPCNDLLIFSIREERLDVHVTIRSNDAIWGWSGINAFEWSVLQEVVAGMVGVVPGSLHFSTTSFHVYETHWNRATKMALEGWNPDGAETLLDRSPAFNATGVDDGEALGNLLESWFILEEMIRNGYCPKEAVDGFSEPMLRSWLRVLQWWWSGDDIHLTLLEGTRLREACRVALQPKREGTDAADRARVTKALWSVTPPESTGDSAFLTYVIDLHNEKHAAYGDSWKRRGEMLGIMANIARKVDRLRGGETADETSTDTAVDLLVYLAKYHTWLMDRTAGSRDTNSDTPGAANDLLRVIEGVTDRPTGEPILVIGELESAFEALDRLVVEKALIYARRDHVFHMILDAYSLARSLWEAERARLCAKCGSLEVNHGPGGSRFYCGPFEAEEYRGADCD